MSDAARNHVRLDRYCSEDASFQLKEVDVAIAHDLGALQFLPRIVNNQGTLAELLYTSRKFGANEAKELGIASKVLPDRDATVAEAVKTASAIAAKSPIGIQGTKTCLNYSREHTIDDSYKFSAIWNGSQILSDDVKKAAQATATKAPVPDFDDL